MEDSGSSLHAAGGDHHCPTHAAYFDRCESCRRARAAFLPYQNVAAHPEPATRSFQSNLGPAFVAPAISETDQIKMAVTSGVVRGIIGLIFGR